MQSEAAKAMEDALSSRVGVVIGVEGARVRVLTLCFALSFYTFAGLLCCAGGGTRTHTRLPSPNFESDKDCAMACDAALRSAFMSLFASFGGIVRVCVRPDCHQSGHQNYRLTPDKRVS
jgi:hypothetical protein